MASTDARPVPRKNVAYRVTFPILDADGDLVTGAASLDSEVSIDGGTFADCTNEATEIATNSGVYFLDLTSGEMNGDTVAVIVKTGTAGAKTTVLVFYPEEVGDYRADVVQISGDTTAADNLEAAYDGAGYAGGTIKQQVDVVAISGDTTSADNLESYTDGTTPMPVNATQISGDSAAADNLETMLDGTGGQTLSLGVLSVTGGATFANSGGSGLTCSSSGSNGHGIVATGNGTGEGISATGGATNGHGIQGLGQGSGSGIRGSGGSSSGVGIFGEATGGNTHGISATGAGSGHGLNVTGGTSGGDGFRINGGLSGGNGVNAIGNTGGAAFRFQAGATGHGMQIIGGSTSGDGINVSVTSGDEINADITGNLSAATADIQSRLPAALVSGRIDASVGAMAANTLTASALAADAVTEIVAGLLAGVIEGTVTHQQALRGILSACAGKASGLATTTAVYRDTTDAIDRITATVDADGNRSAVTLNLS